MVDRFQKKVVTNQLTLTAGILISILLWAAGYIIQPIATLWETIGAYALYAFIGYLLIVLNKSFSIIRLRASFQTVIFMLFVGVSPKIHTIYAGNITTLCFLAALYLCFRSFQLKRTSGFLFHAFMFLGFGCILIPVIVWLIPFIWFACIKFRSLNIKSFIASVFGWSIPIGGYAIYLYLNNRWSEFLDKAMIPVTLRDTILDNYQFPAVVTLSCLFIVFFVSATHAILNSLDEKVQARVYLNHIIITTSALFALMFFFPADIRHLIPITLLGVSFLFGHFATLTHSKWSNIFFILVLLCTIPIFIINLLY